MELDRFNTFISAIVWNSMSSSLLYLYYFSQLIHSGVLTVLLYIIDTLFGCFMFCLQQHEHGMDFRSSC